MTKEELLKKIDFEKSWLYDCGIFGSDIDVAFHAIKNSVIEALEQEPFINKPCVSSGVCEHDKNKILDKIRVEIEQVVNQEKLHDEKWASGLKYALHIIDKYKAESEDKE